MITISLLKIPTQMFCHHKKLLLSIRMENISRTLLKVEISLNHLNAHKNHYVSKVQRTIPSKLLRRHRFSIKDEKKEELNYLRHRIRLETFTKSDQIVFFKYLVRWLEAWKFDIEYKQKWTYCWNRNSKSVLNFK